MSKLLSSQCPIDLNINKYCKICVIRYRFPVINHMLLCRFAGQALRMSSKKLTAVTETRPSTRCEANRVSDDLSLAKQCTTSHVTQTGDNANTTSIPDRRQISRPPVVTTVQLFNLAHINSRRSTHTLMIVSNLSVSSLSSLSTSVFCSILGPMFSVSMTNRTDTPTTYHTNCCVSQTETVYECLILFPQNKMYECHRCNLLSLHLQPSLASLSPGGRETKRKSRRDAVSQSTLSIDRTVAVSGTGTVPRHFPRHGIRYL